MTRCSIENWLWDNLLHWLAFTPKLNSVWTVSTMPYSTAHVRALRPSESDLSINSTSDQTLYKDWRCSRRLEFSGFMPRRPREVLCGRNWIEVVQQDLGCSYYREVQINQRYWLSISISFYYSRFSHHMKGSTNVRDYEYRINSGLEYLTFRIHLSHLNLPLSESASRTYVLPLLLHKISSNSNIYTI
jgi:hypothetical protein